MIRIFPNLTLSRVVGLCCLTGAVLMTAACSDSKDYYTPTTDIPETVDLSSSSSSSSSSTSSSTGGPVILEVDMTAGWRAQPDTVNWDYAGGAVWYEPTDGQHQLVTDLTTPRNFNGAKLTYTVEVDSVFVESGSNLQVLFQQKTDGYPGFWDCTIEAAALADGEETYDCTLPETGWNLEHSSGVQVGLQTPGDQEAVPAGTATILDLTITLAEGSTPPPSPVNLIPDGGFEGEDLATGWNNWSGGLVGLTTDEQFAGAQSLWITNRTTDTAGGQFVLTNAVAPGTTYTVKAMAKHTNTTPDLLKINAKVECEGGTATYPAVVQLDNVAGDEWTEMEGELVIPDCDVSEVFIYFENTSQAVDIYVDDISVMAAEPVNNLVADGGFEGETLTWTAWAGGVPSLSTDQKVTGEQSLLISDRTTANAGAAYALTSGVTAGTTYRVTAKAKHMGAATDLLKINAKISCDGTDTYPMVAQVTDAAADNWTLLEGDLVIPECTTVGEALIYFEGTAQDIDVYVDNVLVVALPEPDFGQQNLVTNGDFETDTAGWDEFGSTATLSASAAEAHSGDQSLLATGRTATGGYAGYDLTGAVTPGATYAVSAWAKHKGAGADLLRVASVVTCTPETEPADHSSYPWINTVSSAPANNWTQLSGNLQVPNCDLTEVKLYFEGTSEGVDVYIDDVSFVEVAAE